MLGLSDEIRSALDTIIEGLGYDFSVPEDIAKEYNISDYISTLDPDKMQKIMNSKISAFNSAKMILDRWINSPNAPKKEVLVGYVNQLINAGEQAISTLRKALSADIDYSKLDPEKHNSAINAKPILLESIFKLDVAVRELERKLEYDDLIVSDREFKLGYPERYAKGEFYPNKDYYKDWYDEDKDAIKIDPFSSNGDMITIDNLNIILPKVPKNKKKILFYNLPKEKQYWRRQPIPKGLNEDNTDDYHDYIMEEFRRRREGIWFMNNGKPVYLTGSHYFALQWGKMLDNGGYMDFRYAQLKMYYHLEAVIIDKRSLGQLFVKSRRTGFTYIIISIMLDHSTSTRNNNFGITSKTNSDAEKAFWKYRYMLLNLPFFFIPMIKGKLDSPTKFEFTAPLKNTRESKQSRSVDNDDYLNNLIDYQPTKNDSYDGQALYMYLGDESGKWVRPNDYIKHFGIVSPTMLEGGKVVGKAFIGSTVGAMDKGGSQFKEMYDSADVLERDHITNMTINGLYRMFLPAHENMTSFTDRYGVCHTTKPDGEVYNVDGDLITSGSVEYLMSQEAAKRRISDNALNEQFRAFPRTIEHAFRDEAEDSVFNITKIYEQVEFNNSIPEHKRYIIGNFDWKDGVIDSDVVFNPNPHGRFKVAWLPSVVDETEKLANRVQQKGDLFYPLNKQLIRIGVDPFSLKSTHGKGSKGAIHGKTVYFPEGGAPANMFVFEYLARPSDETIFFEDVIKVMRYYGSPILAESNRIDLLRHIRNRGYRPFSMNRLDRPYHKLNSNEKEYGGQTMSSKDILDSHMNAIGHWVEHNVGVYNKEDGYREYGEMGEMPFNDTLNDWLKFDPDKRTKYDATISSGLAIMACQVEKYKGKKKPKKKNFKINELFPKYKV